MVELRGVELLETQAATLFELTESGRMLRTNTPDRPAAPRVWLGGSAAGNVLRIRVDVGEHTVCAIEELVAREPPLRNANAAPTGLAAYIELLAAEAPVEDVERVLTYVFPDSFRHDHEARVVGSHTPEGVQLGGRLETEMPADLVELGFVDATHLWPPWCVALDEGAVVAVAMTARLSATGAEAGVATVPAARGRGFAAAATAGWALLPSLEGRVRFYSTALENVSSQRVADRLGLRSVGSSLSIR